MRPSAGATALSSERTGDVRYCLEHRRRGAFRHRLRTTVRHASRRGLQDFRASEVAGWRGTRGLTGPHGAPLIWGLSASTVTEALWRRVWICFRWLASTSARNMCLALLCPRITRVGKDRGIAPSLSLGASFRRRDASMGVLTMTRDPQPLPKRSPAHGATTAAGLGLWCLYYRRHEHRVRPSCGTRNLAHTVTSCCPMATAGQSRQWVTPSACAADRSTIVGGTPVCSCRGLSTLRRGPVLLRRGHND